jgi:hypothetical protein
MVFTLQHNIFIGMAYFRSGIHNLVTGSVVQVVSLYRLASKTQPSPYCPRMRNIERVFSNILKCYKSEIFFVVNS